MGTPTKTSFREVNALKPKRLITVVSGGYKDGKTHFALTAPKPMAFLSLDFGTEGVINKFDHSQIKLAEYSLTVQPGEGSKQEVLNSAYAAWEQFKFDHHYALADPKVRTVVWDTESEAWELIRLANFGELNPKTGRDRGNVWGPINAEFLGLMRAVSGTDKNFIMLQKTKDEYKDDKKTGKRIPKGMGDTPFAAQLVTRAFRDGEQFKIEITDCRDNPDYNGMIFDNDFNAILEMIRG